MKFILFSSFFLFLNKAPRNAGKTLRKKAKRKKKVTKKAKMKKKVQLPTRYRSLRILRRKEGIAKHIRIDHSDILVKKYQVTFLFHVK